jgi:hypothetical protein
MITMTVTDTEHVIVMSNHNLLSASDLIRGYAELVRSRVDANWSPYLLTMMFRQLPGSTTAVMSQKRREAQRVYSTFVTYVVRKSH